MNGAQHTSKPPPATPEFTRRAAIAWIRAADAGLIDAGELDWLLAHLPSDPHQVREATPETSASSDRDIRLHPTRAIRLLPHPRRTAP